MKNLKGKYKITVCCDGFVSIMENPSDRRLKSALPVHSSDTIEEAMYLVNKVCNLQRCRHGKRTGTLLEPKAPNWPIHGGGTIGDLENLAEIFKVAQEERDLEDT